MWPTIADMVKGQGKRRMKEKSEAQEAKSPPLSKAFLIRCWQQEGQWRFMLEDVSTRERQVFVGIAEMVRQLTDVLDPPTAENR